MIPSLTDVLCTRCALCCDGSLFADVELSGTREATGLEILGLEVDDDDADGPRLSLPCAALRGTRCGIYAHRPGTCRSFECRLLRDVRGGVVGVEQAGERITEAQKRIGRVKRLLVPFERGVSPLPLKERCAEALARDARVGPNATRRRAELESAMLAVESLIATTFLDPVAARGGSRR